MGIALAMTATNPRPKPVYKVTRARSIMMTMIFPGYERWWINSKKDKEGLQSPISCRFLKVLSFFTSDKDDPSKVIEISLDPYYAWY